VWFDRAANFGISIPPNKMGWEEFQKLRLREKTTKRNRINTLQYIIDQISNSDMNKDNNKREQ